ncbi:MAG: hypothetical protein RLZZ09_552, partial [Pseudomonadota bacterium]
CGSQIGPQLPFYFVDVIHIASCGDCGRSRPKWVIKTTNLVLPNDHEGGCHPG